MKRERRIPLFDWLAGRRTRPAPEYVDDAASDASRGGLTGAALEQAYRDLLLQNQVLAESNARLQARVAECPQDSGPESTADRQLIRAQREALVERSRHLRGVEFELKQLQREHDKRLAESDRLKRQVRDLRLALRREEVHRRELAETKSALRAQANELTRLTDRYRQLQAQLKPQPPSGSVANGRF